MALVSGGKDSFYNISHCLSQGHELVALANLYPKETQDHEIDSFMFQTVGHTIIEKYLECLDVPLYRHTISKGGSVNQDLEYAATQNDEVEDLYDLMRQVLSHHPEVEGVSCGAILSHYQRTRVEHVCDRLGLTSLTYLWQRLQYDLMKEMCDSGLDARVIKVAAIGLDHSHLGKLIQQLFPHLVKINAMYDVHICGEGGEFETMVFDAPFFRRRLQIVASENIKVSNDDVAFLKLEVEVVDKDQDSFADVARPAPLTAEFAEIYAELKEHGIVADDSKKREYTDDSHSLVRVVSRSCYVGSSSLHICDLWADAPTAQQQIRDIFVQLKRVLDAHYCSYRNIQHVTLLLQDMSDFAPINAVYSQYFADQYLPPLRVCVAARINAKVTLSCVVLEPGVSKSGIHIRSRSYWAPQNIGPYSQAIVETGEKFRLATLSGQIPLVPETMEIAGKDLYYDAILSLQHLDRVKFLIDVPGMAYGVCFTTTERSTGVAQQTWKMSSNVQAPLIIARVLSLPRNASIEWAGVSYKKLIGMYDDFSDGEDNTESDERPLPLAGIITEFEEFSVIDIGVTQFCVLAFTNDDSRLEKLATIDTDIYAQIYARLVHLLTAKRILQNHVIEGIPVESCHSRNQEFKYGLVLRFSI